MRNTLPLLSRPQPSSTDSTPTQAYPSIRLISATPSASGLSAAANSSPILPSPPSVAPFATQSPSALAPRESRPPRKRLVPKKSKLGLLGAVNAAGNKVKDKAGSKDFSDVVRRIGGPAASASAGKGFEIYVDQGDEKDVNEIVVVKKKKSRLGLDGMRWGSLGEVTNIPATSASKEKAKEKAPVEHLLKVKGEDSQRWWSIGRGRKDSKEKGKSKENKEQQPPSRATSPQPSRSRFNSIDSGLALSNGKTTKTGTMSSMNTLLSCLNTSDNTPLDVPPSAETQPQSNSNTGTGSIAIRAMKSMRSLARMKSWATLTGSISTHPNNDKEGSASTNHNTNTITSSKKIKEKKTEKKDEKKDERKKEKKEGKRKAEKEEKKVREKKVRDKTLRYSGSSFEAGAPSTQTTPVPPHSHPEEIQKTAKKKQSILGLGLPSTRLGTVRTFSNASSASSVGPASNSRKPSSSGRLSVDSAPLITNAQARPSSLVSTNSSLRPPSTASGASVFSERSQRSSSGSAVSIRWDEEGIRNAKAMQRKERKTRKEKDRTTADSAGGLTKRGEKESKRSSESKRRVPISEIFPGTMEPQPDSLSSKSSLGNSANPIVTVEEATVGGHSYAMDEEEGNKTIMASKDSEGQDEDATPVHRIRPRPLSEQPLSKSRPQGMHNDGDVGVISILDAATNDLASLINRLDLEATPASSNGTPFRPSPLTLSGSPSRALLPRDDSPVKRRLATKQNPPVPQLPQSKASISSLRPYAKAQVGATSATRTIRPKKSLKAADLVGQQIAPWSTLNWQVSPKRPTSKPSTLRPKRSMVPVPAVEPPIVFHPLKPAKSIISPIFSQASSAASVSTPPVNSGKAPSSCTFGSKRSSKVGVEMMDEDEDEDPAPTPTRVSNRSSSRTRPESLGSTVGRTGSVFSLRSMYNAQGIPISPEAMRGLGLAGTMGSAIELQVDPEDPDSDIPNELQEILAEQSDEENTDLVSLHHSLRPLSPPPVDIPLPPTPPSRVSQLLEELHAPIYRAQLDDEEANHGDVDDGASEEDDTKRSFDFTGELQRLSQSGVSDRRSFVEQLENAFRTPAMIDLGLDTDFQATDAPPIPAILVDQPHSPEDFSPRSVSRPQVVTYNSSGEEITQDISFCDSSASDTLEHILAEREDDLCRPYPEMRRSNPSMRSKASDGQLNVDFRFGGKFNIPEPVPQIAERRPLTLSDILAPPSHVFSEATNHETVEEDSSVLQSIMAHASQVPQSVARRRLDSFGSTKRQSSQFSRMSRYSAHSRNTSGSSFNGFDSFEEVRRGFEFHPNRPAFYPPPEESRPRNKHASMYSIASVSSYGAVFDFGKPDPFGYAPSRPTSEDVSMSMSMTVDDTFSFMKRERRRQRVDSDASSFYYRPGGVSSLLPEPSRRSRRPLSMLSTVSNAPPVSLYNRNYGGHRRSDSNSSAGSVAQTNAMFGAHGGRAIWSRHRQNASIGSISSEHSAMRGMDRPGLGDKMFEMDHGMPLTSITASPTGSFASEFLSQPGPSSQFYRTTFDSIIDAERPSYPEDSIFSKTGYRNSAYSSDGSVFGFDMSDPGQGRRMSGVPGFLPPNHFRPLSMMSVASAHSAQRDDDTMITMIGGGHVRRRSVDSMVDGSPCIRIGMERKRHLREIGRVLQFDQTIQEVAESPSMSPAMSPAKSPARDTPGKTRLTVKPSIASTSSQPFGGERMIVARKGLLQRQSLEDSALITQEEDLLASLRSQGVFSRPSPAPRSRASTVTSCSGGETPPLSCSDGSSISGGSQSSIDVGQLSSMLSNYARPAGGLASARVRARARGTGHRRRFSQTRASRSSVYETIQEESTVFSSSPSPLRLPSPPPKIASPLMNNSIFVVDSDTQSFSEDWDSERGIVGLRRYYALQDEARVTVEESKQLWADTPFSIFAVQAFQPPTNRGGMRAMLEHSRQTYGPLPSELRSRRIRSRTSSRASPYPVRAIKSRASSEQSHVLSDDGTLESFEICKPFVSPARRAPVAPLQDTRFNPNIDPYPSSAFGVKSFSSFSIKVDDSVVQEKTGVPLQPRQRVASGVKRTAPSSKKRNTGKSSTSECKENMSQASIINPSDSLRISRPRPRGRIATTRAPGIRV